MLKSDQLRVKQLLEEAIPVVCKNSLNFESEFCIEAVIGITLDQHEMIHFSIRESFKLENSQTLPQLSQHVSFLGIAQNVTSVPSQKRRRRQNSLDNLLHKKILKLDNDEAVNLSTNRTDHYNSNHTVSSYSPNPDRNLITEYPQKQSNVSDIGIRSTEFGDDTYKDRKSRKLEHFKSTDERIESIDYQYSIVEAESPCPIETTEGNGGDAVSNNSIGNHCDSRTDDSPVAKQIFVKQEPADEFVELESHLPEACALSPPGVSSAADGTEFVCPETSAGTESFQGDECSQYSHLPSHDDSIRDESDENSSDLGHLTPGSRNSRDSLMDAALRRGWCETVDLDGGLGRKAKRLYVCPFCQEMKSYSDQRNLRDHIEFVHLHQAEKYKCAECGRAYRWRQHLQRHKRQFHSRLIDNP